MTFSKSLTLPISVTVRCPVCHEYIQPGEQVVIDEYARTIHLDCVRDVKIGPRETKIDTDWLKFED